MTTNHDFINLLEHHIGDLTVQPYTSNMTLRDHFAALAMQSYLSRSLENVSDDTIGVIWGELDIAEMAYEQADAMMEARK